MANDKIEIDVGLNTGSFLKGLNTITSKLNKFGQGLKGLANLGNIVTGWKMAFDMVGKTISTVAKAMNETIELSNKQIKAEIQLETAAKHNPYLDSSSVQKLKNYASELQSISTIGDEELLPMMAQLAASGRTQAEIQDIMKAALDASASGAVDMSTAVRSLNQSYEGNVGALSRVLPSLKNLTAEELKQGGAVRAVARAYDGMAKKTSDATGAAERLNNAWGDFKENIGSTVGKLLNPLKQKLAEIITDINNANAEKNATKKADEDIKNQQATVVSYEVKIKEIESQIVALKERKVKAQSIGDKLTEGELNAQIESLKAIKTQYNLEKGKLQAKENQKKADIQAAETEAKKKAEIESATEFIIKQRNEYEKQKKVLEERAKLVGEEVSEMDLLNLKVQQYMNVWSSDHVKYATAEIAKLKNDIDSMTASIKNKFNFDEFVGQFNLGVSEEIKNAKELLTSFYKEGIIQKEEYNEKIKLLDEALTKAEEAEAEKQKEKFLEVANIINDVLNNLTQAMQQMAELASKRAEDNAKAQTAALEKQFAEGQISEEEYYAKKEKIEKDAAREKYKADLWAWAAGLLQIGTSTAMAIMQAFATLGPIAGGIMAGAIGTLGAVQTAVAISNKPVPPSFATGGFVGGMNGASMGGDNTYAHVRQGEFIMNAKQQRELWDLANGKGSFGGSVSNNVQIKNYRGNDTRVDTQFTEDGLRVFIRESIQDDQRNGRLRESFLEQQNILDGVKYM